MNYSIFLKLYDRMRFEVNCKSHHRVISDGLICQVYPVNKDVVHVLPKPILMQGLHHSPFDGQSCMYNPKN